MRTGVALLFVLLLAVTLAHSGDNKWYAGDERCPPPKDNGQYSAPYNALDFPHDYPTFPGADKSGWSCSYSREDGVIVQYGDSRTPKEQWLAIWGGDNGN